MPTGSRPLQRESAGPLTIASKISLSFVLALLACLPAASVRAGITYEMVTARDASDASDAIGSGGSGGSGGTMCFIANMSTP
jgi:hypothetical protein